MSYNIAVDGPAGAGKSTIAREVARRLNIIYVDTGAMYRGMALYILRQGINPDDEQAVIARCDEADITLRHENGVQVVYLNGENVNAYIRTEEVGSATSRISVLAPVRRRITALQHELAACTDCIMDGRDIGTCVLPDADVKIYLTASSAVRARRRYDELTARGQSCDLAQIQADMEERDYRDMHREVSPLRQAEDAVLVDSSDMTPEQVVERILKLCRR
ncbi:MAG: (d)CMP kinase [bacterium]|nr:(d)CMP kinase [bacterium]MCM1376019.1 (d)CMP kinase [Muribaculum sp.]